MIFLDDLLDYEKQLQNSNLPNAGYCLALCRNLESNFSHKSTLTKSVCIPSFFPAHVILEVFLKISKAQIKVEPQKSDKILIRFEEVEE